MSLNGLKSTIKKVVNAHLPLSASPFEVKTKIGIDATKTKPYFVETNISYGDPIFKKRISSILKEEKYLLVYEFMQKNEGSFFKPSYQTVLEMYMTKQLISTSGAILLDVLTLGLVDTHLTKEGIIKIKSLKRRTDCFQTEIECNLFAEKIQFVLTDFLTVQHNEYLKIISKEDD